MSYILDALRKADAERSRGSVPGLASQPLPAAMADTPAARAGRPGWTWAAGGAALALGLVALAWVFWGRDVAPAVAPTAAPAAAPLPPAASPAIVPAPAPVAGAITLPVAPPPEPARTASPPPAPVAPPPTRPLAAAVPSVPREAPTIAPRRADEAVADPATPRRLPSLAELPEAVRRQLPPLALGGSVWSEQSSSRFVMLDGQLLREGESFGPGLVVERIDPRSVRLAWRETRFEVRW